jgi:AcrR family transcriptional regulator
MPTQGERRAASTRLLLEATVELIGEKGFERTTAAEIGERAGFSRTMVRSRYGTKEALLEALMRAEYEPRLMPRRVEDDPTQGLELALGQVIHTRDLAAESPEFLRAFFILVFEAVGPIAGLRPWLEGWLERYEAGIAAALRVGQRDGSVRPAVDPGLEAHRVNDVGLGLAFRWALDPRSDFVGAFIEWHADLRARWTS